MPLFEYKGKDKSRATSGTIEAASHGVALTTLKNRGIQVVMLRPATVKAPPPAPSEALSPSSSLDELDSRKRRGIAALVAMIALLAVYLATTRLFASWGDITVEKGETQRVLEIKGRVDFASTSKASDPWRNATIAFVLPEVPAEHIARRRELAFNAVGDFTIKIHYLSSVPARMMNVRASCRGCRSRALSRIEVPLEPGSPVLLPTITLDNHSSSSSNSSVPPRARPATIPASAEPPDSRPELESEPEAEPGESH